MFSLLRPRGPRVPDPAAITVSHGGRSYVVAVRRSARARKLTLRIRSASRDAVVTLPQRLKFAEAEAFVIRHAGWLAVRLDKFGESIGFVAGESVPLRGEALTITLRPDLRGAVRVIGDTLSVPGDPAFIARKVEAFLKAQAKADLMAATARHAATLGVSVTRVGVRDTQSRWGSCSSSGAINYSWRLILAPPFVLDYLCAHEVAHRREMNHSPRFWRLVHQLCPHTDQAKAWLRLHGARLHHYGAP